MIRLTVIARLSDGLYLAESMDDNLSSELPDFKAQTRGIIKSLNEYAEKNCTIESGYFNFHYMLDNGVVYMCLCEKLFPRRLAFAYLLTVQEEFQKRHGRDVAGVHRPYAFIQFDTFLRTTARQYKDNQSGENLSRLNEELSHVTRIMTRNIQDVMQRGEKIDKLSLISSQLTSESNRFAKESRQLRINALLRQYSGTALIIGILLLVLYLWLYY